VYTVQVGFGALLSLTGILLANVMAGFFHRPDAVHVIRAMALLILIQSFGQTATALLRRALHFKRVQVIGIASYLIGYVLIGIPCAYYGLGPWSLAAAHLVQSLLYTFLAMHQSRVPMRPVFKPSSPGLFAFGSKVISANLFSWGIVNLDSFVIGRMLGIVDLGLYNRTMMLVASPRDTVTISLQGVLFAACSRAQHDIPQLRKAYFAATAMIGLICLPVFVTVACVPNAVINGLYGSKWTAAVPVLIPLALAMPVHALLAVIGPVLMGMDKVGLELRAQMITLVISLPVFYLTGRYSLAMVAWGVLVIYVLRWFLLARFILQALNADWADLLRVMLWPFLCALAAALPTWGVDRLLAGISPTQRLAIDIAMAALALAGVMRLLGKRILSGPHGDYLLANGRLPAPLRRWVRV
jgi:PST family polysaccharide transporter